MPNLRRFLLLVTAILFIQPAAFSQEIKLLKDVEYEIAGISIAGSGGLDESVIVLLSGLSVGDIITIPSEKFQKAIQTLWEQKLFSDVGIYVVQKQSNRIFIEIRLTPLPKLSRFYFTGPIKKSKKNDLREELKLSRGTVISENLIISSESKIKKIYVDKGYLNAQAKLIPEPDTVGNTVTLRIHVDPGPRIKIEDIVFHGAENLAQKKLRKSLKETKRVNYWNVFKSSKYIPKNYKEDKELLVKYYNTQGHRDMRITRDSVYAVGSDRIRVDIFLEEGNKYYFRDITWLGNTKYNTEILNRILRIQKGDIYDSGLLNERLFFDPGGNDVSSIYLDNGYLFFNLIPVETSIENDSIDIELRIREGRQATINYVRVKGNDRTNDNVIYRELRTRPGDLFSRSDIQRSMRELQQLGYFDQQSLDVGFDPNPETGTVDVEYTVQERSTSQLELQGGWGANMLIGTLGLNFNNFSARNFFNKRAWQPLPTGDGQTISLRAQSSGRFFQSYNASFTEPWLGGRKPQSLTFSLYRNIQANGLPRNNPERQGLVVTGANLGLGKRLRWPDDYFTLFQSIEFKQLRSTWRAGGSAGGVPGGGLGGGGLGGGFMGGGMFGVGNIPPGTFNNFNMKMVLGRNSTDVPIFPTRGSTMNLTLEFTPPYSLIDGRDYSQLDIQERFRMLEYYKWKFNNTWFSQLYKNLVVRTHAEFGFMGNYNSAIGNMPFDRFFLGGDGLQNFFLDGREIIALRGYPNQSITPTSGEFNGGVMYNKYNMELRYLLTNNPSAQIFVLGFLEAGNNFGRFSEYNPFLLKRSAGGGIRIFMPMFGLLGVDVGHGFDNIPGQIGRSGWQTHFIIGQQF
jgi:outer membrane protein insertion porin family